MTQEEKAKAYDEALDRMKHVVIVPKDEKALEILKETIFPELQESNDERTKKSLIKFLTDIKEISESGRTSWAVRKEDAEMCKSFLAWLEKQKEKLGDISTILLVKKEIERRIETWQKSRKELIAMECNTLADDAAVRIEELYSLISFLGTIRCNTNEKQKEQKDYRKLYEDIAQSEWFKKAYAGKSLGEEFEQKEQKPFNVCEQCPYYKTCPDYNAQKPAGATINGEPIPTENKSVDIPLAEWSEEDDSMLNTIIADVKFVQQKCGLGTDEWNVHSEAIRWIKSLSERFNLQPKQEWSEEDERMQKEVEKMIVLFT